MSTRREFLTAAPSLTTITGATLASTVVGRAAPYAPGKKVRLGIVGGGFGSTFQFHEHPNCEVAAVTDLRPERREKLRKTYRCDTVYDSLEQMLASRTKLDAVAVFSGAPDHYRHVEMCNGRCVSRWP